MLAVVLAGGRGSRLLPYTAVIPKPLMPIGEQTVIEILLRQLAHHGVRDVLMCVGYQAHLIQAVIGDGARLGLSVAYRREDQPLGTVGPLREVQGELPERFLVLNGDILCDLDFAEFHRQAAASGAALTVAAFERQSRIDLGVLDLDDGGRVTGFREKPTYTFWVSMGVYAMSRRVLDFIPAGRAFGFDDLMHALLAADEPIATHRFSGHWLDIGRSDDFAAAQDEFLRHADRYVLGG